MESGLYQLKQILPCYSKQLSVGLFGFSSTPCCGCSCCVRHDTKTLHAGSCSSAERRSQTGPIFFKKN
ncbi:hypothetical protein BDA96_06G193400 [Sorghum bicolor]|uniref:Uncharacterized protein n=2 Tax=Sorghum bicolor TaxID=4558 RepID=A0A921QUU9_SORBI|nr:hypothetical protein BDA96_06G193400 [Sorghum bicolor]KXG26893.1 hypothetical protein SORBI_3006G176900 [Sorghum bicolor]